MPNIIVRWYPNRKCEHCGGTGFREVVGGVVKCSCWWKWTNAPPAEMHDGKAAGAGRE